MLNSVFGDRCSLIGVYRSGNTYQSIANAVHVTDAPATFTRTDKVG